MTFWDVIGWAVIGVIVGGFAFAWFGAIYALCKGGLEKGERNAFLAFVVIVAAIAAFLGIRCQWRF
jgi:hypothetical protein